MAKQQTALARLVSEIIPKGSCKPSIRRAALGYARLVSEITATQEPWASSRKKQLELVRAGLEDLGSETEKAQALLLAVEIA